MAHKRKDTGSIEDFEIVRPDRNITNEYAELNRKSEPAMDEPQDRLAKCPCIDLLCGG